MAPQGWAVVPEQQPAAAPVGWAPVAEPTFKAENAVDAEGHSIVRDISDAWGFLNTPLLPHIQRAASKIAELRCGKGKMV